HSKSLTQNPALLRPFADFRITIARNDLPIFVEEVISLAYGNNNTSGWCIKVGSPCAKHCRVYSPGIWNGRCPQQWGHFERSA
uniref:Uncharacterized protein n=1 Tax=Romanomermis culicivorax TaxID=13658 RepID=A0A915IBB0_ROMCU